MTDNLAAAWRAVSVSHSLNLSTASSSFLSETEVMCMIKGTNQAPVALGSFSFIRNVKSVEKVTVLKSASFAAPCSSVSVKIK